LEAAAKGLSVALVTLDSRLASSLLAEASDRGVRVLHIAPGDEPPLSVKAIITKRTEKTGPSSHHVIFAEDYSSPRAILDRAVEVCAGKSEARHVTVSIDPGKRMGVAFLTDGVVVRTTTCFSNEELVESIDEFVRNHPQSELSFVIGSGAPSHREEMLRFLRSRLPYIWGNSVNLVPEDRTSLRKSWLRGRKTTDEVAAASLPNRLRRTRLGSQ